VNNPAPASEKIRRHDIGDTASFVAVALSMLALGTSAYQSMLMRDQTKLMQVQSRASVWPSVSIGENDTHTPTEDMFAWRVDNNGVGPAKIESVVVNLDGKPYGNWQTLSAVLAPGHPFHAAQSSVNGLVLPPSLNRETTVEMVKLSDPVLARAFHDAQSRFKIEICYCSVYDDCWIANINDRGERPMIDRCETAGTTQFEQ
jgi:hypothetical protein